MNKIKERLDDEMKKKLKDEKVLEKNCEHEMDPASVEFDPRYGRRGRCIHCGCKIVQYRYSETKHGKERMSKKERLRRRREGK